MFSLLVGLLFAQDLIATPSPNLAVQYRQDYQYQLSTYQTKYLEYLNKKDVYTKYKTITSENDKIEAAKAVLIARNNLLKSYFLAIRVKLDEFESQDPTETEKIQIELKKWEDWADEQNLIIGNLNNQNGISDWVSLFKEKYIAIQVVSYTGLVQDQINQRRFILEKITDLSTKMRTDPKLVDQLSEWLNNLPVKSDLVNQSLQKAKLSTQTTQFGRTFSDFYPTAKSNIYEADSYLQKMISDLRAVAIKLNQ